MDWLLDGSMLSKCGTDLDKVFKYDPGVSRVVQLQASDDRPRECTLGDRNWKEWFIENFNPKPEEPRNGVTLVFARRAESETPSCRAKSIRYLPFSYETFQLIANKLLIHSGISRVVSRGDVAVFSTGEVDIGEPKQPAIVYHCRSSDSWSNDMALSVTHCLNTGSTYGIVFGSTPKIEAKILNRLSFSQNAVRHPLLLPGIFAELERERQLKDLVEGTQIDLESTISTLSMQDEDEKGSSQKGPALQENNKTLDLWLNTTELRNGLANWRTQLEDMLNHASQLTERGLSSPAANVGQDNESSRKVQAQERNTARISGMIKNRLRSIIHEYEESIRDCTMRVDGMAMATQLCHAHTNMHISFDAKRDGKRLQNISMFSMIFLPSMFVATIFSTDFFNWFPHEGQAIISPYFWVLIAFSACLTFFILGGYYLLSSRVLSFFTIRLKCSESVSPV